MNVSSATPFRFERILDAAKTVKAVATRQRDNLTGSKFIQALKKVANIPLNLARSHPKIIVAAGAITTIVGAATVNPAIIGIGAVLLSVGTLVYISNKHEETKGLVAAKSIIENKIPVEKDTSLDNIDSCVR